MGASKATLISSMIYDTIISTKGGVEMKKDIFNGKIKKEYFSYIFGYMVFFVLLFIGVGVLCICASVWGMPTNSLGERLLIASFGGIAFVLSVIYVILELLVIRNFPKYQKLRRILFNSDCYFTNNTSDEYFGSSRTIRGLKNKIAFKAVTAFADAEKGMGNKKSVRYTVYSALALITAVLSIAFLIVMPLLFENGVILSKMSDDGFAVCYIFGGIVCIAFAIFFIIRAYKVVLMLPFENYEWKSALYTSLVDISIHQNNKKLKYWYNIDQFEKIEDLVKSASENAELKLETKGNKLVSFKVVDTLNQRVVFTGLFI